MFCQVRRVAFSGYEGKKVEMQVDNMYGGHDGVLAWFANGGMTRTDGEVDWGAD